MQPLRVNIEDLHVVAGTLEALGDEVAAVRTSAPTGSPWLASSAAVSVARTDARAARAALVARFQSTSQKLATAAAAYAESDARLAAKLRDLTVPAAR